MRTIRFRPWFRAWIHELLRQGRVDEAARAVYTELIYAVGAGSRRDETSDGEGGGSIDLPHADRCSAPEYQRLISPEDFYPRKEYANDELQPR